MSKEGRRGASLRGGGAASAGRLRRALGRRSLRVLLVATGLGTAAGVLWWRGPDWRVLYHAFDFVAWRWIAAGVLLNLLSTIVRALSWRLTLAQALPDPHPTFGHVFSSYGVGLLGNAVLPARAGELARVAVLRRHLGDHGSGTTPTLVGTVVAHRLFDIVPVAMLVVYVILTAKIPSWAVTSLAVTLLFGAALLAVATLVARRGHARSHRLEAGLGTWRKMVVMARQGLAVLRAPLPAIAAVCLQISGWVCQILAVWAVMSAFALGAPLPAAGLVLLLMNVATIFPLWPGNVGLLQAAIALPLVQYGVDYATGFAYAIALQAVEMSVGVGVGFVFLAREGLSLASLKRLEEEEEETVERTVAARGTG